MAENLSAKKTLQILWLLWLLGFSGTLLAQNEPVQFEFRHIQEKQGLSLNLVNCFLQDRDGFLWIGTYSGLNRYDGHQFIVFKHQRDNMNSLLNNTVHDLCEDQQGNIWMGVENGICYYEKTTGRFRNIHTVKGHPLQACWNVLCDRNGDIWFTSFQQGLFHYTTKTGTIERFSQFPRDTLAGGLNRVPKNGLILDPYQQRIWLVTGEGTGYFDINSKAFFDYRRNPQQLPILTNHFTSAITLDSNHLIFADNVDKKIIVYDLLTMQITKTITPTTIGKNDIFSITTIFADRQHNLWVSLSNYRVLYIEVNTDRITELTHNDAKPTSIASNFFWDGWQHPDGSIWLGTVNGVSFTNPERTFYTLYDIEAIYPDLTKAATGISQFLEDDDGSWWLGTHIRGLLHYVPQTNRLQVYKLPDAPDEFPYGGYVCAVLPYGKELFVVSNIGFSRFDKQTKTVQKIPLPPGQPPYTSQKCGIVYHREIWLGNDDGRVFSYSPQTGQWRNYPVDAPSGDSRLTVRNLLVDKKGDLWAEVYPDGFARLDRQQARFKFDKPALHTNFTTNVASSVGISKFDQKDAIWIATHGFGLWRYTPATKKYDNWTESDGLAYDMVQYVLPDQFGNIWASAYNKFTVFTPAKGRFMAFTLPINEANLQYGNYLFQLRNGHIMAAMRGFMVEFAPEKLLRRPTKIKDKILIGRVDTADTTIVLHSGVKTVRLQADNNDFTVHFAALVPPDETPFQYMYKLTDYDDWKVASISNSVTYNKIPGGDYKLSIKGVSIDGQETPTANLMIHIDTHFYRMGWFWGIIGLTVLGLGLGFGKYRSQQTARFHALQVQATRLERDKTEIQYQNLINHLNPHFLFNSLTSLSSLIIIDPRQASAFLRKLSVIYRYILQNKDKEVVTLEDELKFVQHYIELQKSRFEEGLQIDVAIPAHYLSRMIVPVTLQNLIENAIKHNMIDDESPLVIRIYPEQNYLCVSNNLQKKNFVETSNKQGLASLKSMYFYLCRQEIEISETATEFLIRVPLL